MFLPYFCFVFFCAFEVFAAIVSPSSTSSDVGDTDTFATITFFR
ncbi:hypothetical protein ECDEC8C_6481 [Escherichia coli DEC8C]|nr:hypothetical protein ECDEC8C_6481 [Escherichia coli DEC8C]EZK32486.1 hypothetical protein AB12_0864 [Escherichia coli 1-182-04_S1_C1]KDA68803.1 hypothetical protein AB40_1750 [Escherichia coli 1-182-04_S1_C2]